MMGLMTELGMQRRDPALLQYDYRLILESEELSKPVTGMHTVTDMISRFSSTVTDNIWHRKLGR